MGGEGTWRDASFSALAAVRSGYAFKSSEWCPTGVPVVKIGNVKNGRLDMDGCSFVDPMVAQASGFMLSRGDILVGLTGYVGDRAIVRSEGPLVLNQRVGKITPRAGVDPRFVYYVLSDPEFRAAIERAAHGSAQANVSPGSIEAIPLSVPPLADQRAIAHILGTLDDKIELNRKMNQTLEEMARALFKSWFVDFDPVRAKAAGKKPHGMDDATAALFPDSFEESELGEIPKGWTVQPLDSIADFRNGLALQNFRPNEGSSRLPVVKIAQLRTGQPDSGEWARDDIAPACILENGDVVFSWSGSLTVVVWCGGRAALNQHLFRVTSATYPKWFYLQWLLEHLPEFIRIAGDKATTMGHIQRHHLTAAKCVVPKGRVIDEATRLFAPLLDQKISLDHESRRLARVRDTLLPRLLSGELRLAQDSSQGTAA